MPAKTKKQQRFAAMSATPAGRKALKASGKKPMPPSVAKDFMHKGKKRRGR